MGLRRPRKGYVLPSPFVVARVLIPPQIVQPSHPVMPEPYQSKHMQTIRAPAVELGPDINPFPVSSSSAKLTVLNADDKMPPETIPTAATMKDTDASSEDNFPERRGLSTEESGVYSCHSCVVPLTEIPYSR